MRNDLSVVVQGSEEWFAQRLGKVTASRIGDVMAKGRSGAPSVTRSNYIAELVAERLSGQTAEGHSSAAMQWGTDTEPQAREAYRFHRQTQVVECGMIQHPKIAMSGASPDGLVGSDGLVEIKCPNSATHIKTVMGAKIDRKYLLQMQWQMACAERDWCDFVSFDPRLGLDCQYWRIRVERDGALISEIETEVASLLEEVDETVAKLRETFGIADAGEDLSELLAGG